MRGERYDERPDDRPAYRHGPVNPTWANVDLDFSRVGLLVEDVEKRGSFPFVRLSVCLYDRKCELIASMWIRLSGADNVVYK